MSTRVDSSEVNTNHPGSENHHKLKNQPGDKGDPKHTEAEGDVSPDVKDTIESSDGDTELADKLKSAVSEDEKSE